MSGLPPALAPWAAPLAGFSPELQVVVGEWARRLASALGPLHGLHLDAGEPDGVAGLSRRGPYERLLLSEWLLATELPDEFLRRASAGEHLFLTRSRRERTAGRRVVALLDAGPAQLGSPRLAQLALLVVLSARAAAAGATLEWSVAQHPGAGRASGFGADRVRRFLDARSLAPVRPRQLEAWWQDLALDEGPAPECWLIGGQGLLALARPGDATVLVEEEVEPETRRLRLVVTARRRERRELLLDLPREADGVRLLRDPFSEATTAPSQLPGRLMPDAGVLFHPSGHRLLVRLEGGDLYDLPVPNSARAKPGRGRRMAASAGLVAAGWLHKRRVAVRVAGDQVWIDRKSYGMAGGASLLPTPAAAGAPIGLLVHASRTSAVLFLDPGGALFHAAEHQRAPELGRLGVHLSALTWDGDLVHCVQRVRGEHLFLNTWGGPNPTAGPSGHDLGTGTGRAFIAAKGLSLYLATEDSADGLWKVRTSPGRPVLFGPGAWLKPPTGATVVGVTPCHAPSPADLAGGEAPAPVRLTHLETPSLVILEADRRSFTLLERTNLTSLHQASGEVAAASLSPDGGVLAYTTRRGGLEAWSMSRKELLLSLLPGGAP